MKPGIQKVKKIICNIGRGYDEGNTKKIAFSIHLPRTPHLTPHASRLTPHAPSPLMSLTSPLPECPAPPAPPTRPNHPCLCSHYSPRSPAAAQ